VNKVIRAAKLKAERDRDRVEEVKQFVLNLSAEYSFGDSGTIDKTGMRPDQVAFWESLERGDHLDTMLLPLSI
jgi:hypothetical protein